MIYFAQLPTGSIKIGCSGDVDSRIKQLETFYGCRLTLLHTMAGDIQAEREIHERFTHLRLGCTEQFRPAPDLMTFIGRPLLVSQNPDAVEPVPRGNGYKTLGYRVSGSYLEWITSAAAANRSTVSGLIDQAVARYAREIGVSEPPPDRTA